MENGSVTEYVGNYDDFTAYRAAHPAQATGTATAVTVNPEKEKRMNDYKQRKEEAAAQRKRKKQIENAENDIERLETELSELNERMTRPEYSSDYEKMMEMTHQAADMQQQIDDLYALLEELYD